MFYSHWQLILSISSSLEKKYEMDGVSSNELMDLEKRIETASTDTARAQALAGRAWKIKYTDPRKAIDLADQAILLTRDSKLDELLPSSFMSKAVSLSQMSDFEAAEEAVKLGLEVYRKQDNQAGILHARNVMGSVYFRWGRLLEALENYLEALKIHHVLKDSPAPGILSNIGGVYLQLGDTDRALECFTQVKKIAAGMQGPADLKAAALINIGEVYSTMKMFEPSLEHLMSAMEIAEANQMKQAIAAINDNIGSVLIEQKLYDEALEYFQDSIEMFRGLQDIKGEALVMVNMGKCYLAQGSNLALEYFIESLNRFKSLNDGKGGSEALIGRAEALIRQGSTEEALKHLSKALEIAGKNGLKPLLSRIHKNLYELFEETGEFEKSLMHIKLYHELENQIRSTKAENQLRNISLIHELEQTRKEVFLCGLRNIKLRKDKNNPDNKAGSEREEGELETQPDEEKIEQLDFLDDITDEKDDFILPPVGKDLTYRSQSGYAVEKRILAVEDDPEVAEFLINALETNGYPVIVSSSMRKAWEIVLSPDEKIGCVFADINLPDGSGIDLIRAIRDKDQDIPILAGSGFPLSDRNRQFLDENRITFIKKPYLINSLILNLITILPAEHES